MRLRFLIETGLGISIKLLALHLRIGVVILNGGLENSISPLEPLFFMSLYVLVGVKHFVEGNIKSEGVIFPKKK